MEEMISGGVTPKKFIKFVWPSVLMMVIIALYYGMDSVFVANFAGEDALAALAIAYPIQGVMWGVAVMLAAGSSAIVAIKMGEGNQKEADEKYTLICAVSVVLGCLFTLFCLIFMEPLVAFLGATEHLKEYCHEFLQIMVWGFPAAFLGSLFEYFIRVDGRPGFTLLLYISGGVVHLALDYLFMVPLEMGIRGAAFANVGGLLAVMLAGGAYFLFMKTKLSFRKCAVDWRYIGHCFANGSSEMVSEASAGITTFVFNMIVVRLIGEVGVAAGSIVFNIHYLLLSVHLGYIMGVAPLISYFYGAKEYEKVNLFLRYSKVFVIVISVVGAAACLLFGQYIVMAFERPGSELYDVAVTGVRFVSTALLLCGMNIFASGFFTAYGNGQISALISTSRGLIMDIVGCILLGWLFGMNGVWLAMAFAEVTTMGLTLTMFRKYKDVYHYKIW